jgi:hypothetical protein
MRHLEKYLAQLRLVCGAIPDPRTGSNTQYRMEDIVLAAFSLFFMQQPSFLAFQRTLHSNTGSDNTCTLFGMEKIPTDNHIRKILDTVEPEHFEQLFFYILDELGSQKAGAIRNSLGEHTLIALDGTEYYSSRNIFCERCSSRELANGDTEYFHRFLSATVVSAASQAVFSLPPEFITAQDGEQKQDCELKAVKRWLARMLAQCQKFNPVFLGDDLFSKQDICTRILEAGCHFLFTCKDASHKTLAEFRKGLTPERHTEFKGTGKQLREYRYSWIEGLPLRDGKEALAVNWLDVEIVNKSGKVTYRSSFITSLLPTRDTISSLISSARARWKIENETFNVLKNNGYHLEHNFGHGKQSLSGVFVTLNLLAFTMHNACDVMESLWQQARAIAGARNRLFSHLWTLTTYHVFLTWQALLMTIISGRPPPAR